jgi:acetylornithine deacetylase/succinyl-diaminopimelate desuccinylase-like protein
MGLWIGRWLRPTCDAVGIHGGFAGEGIKTIVPARAFVKVACRLVPDQDPDYIIDVRALIGCRDAAIALCFVPSALNVRVVQIQFNHARAMSKSEHKGVGTHRKLAGQLATCEIAIISQGISC